MLIRMLRRTGGVGTLAGATLVLVACRAADSVGIRAPSDAPCAGAAGLALSALSAATLDCSAGTTVELSGGGASYLVAAQLAAGDGSAAAVEYTISVPGTAVAAVMPVAATAPAPSFAVAPAAWARGGPLPRAFDAALRAYGARLGRRSGPAAGAGARSSGESVVAAGAASGAAPAVQVGSSRSFQVLATADVAHLRYAPVSARLAYVGTNLLIYVDEAAPARGFTDADLTRFGRYFDEVLYPLDLDAFGPPTDIDHNGRLIMLLSPVVNALVSPGVCATQGFIGGFFNPNDLSGGASSNHGEIFYALVPDPSGSASCAHGVAETEALLGATFLHEMQHLISYSQRVVVHGGSPNAGWLDEGLSLVAEELGSIYYEARYPAPAGRSRPDQLVPDSARPFLDNPLASAYAYLQGTDTSSLTTHADADPGAAWRGGDWLLLRWLGDQKGGGAFYRALEQGTATGIAAVEAAARERFPALFGDFALALFTDSLVGVPRGEVPVRNTFPGRNLRRLFAVGYGGYPLEPVPLTGPTFGRLVPGSIALYRIHTTPGSATVTLRFSDPTGAPLPAALQPQLSVFRLPDG